MMPLLWTVGQWTPDKTFWVWVTLWGSGIGVPAPFLEGDRAAQLYPTALCSFRSQLTAGRETHRHGQSRAAGRSRERQRDREKLRDRGRQKDKGGRGRQREAETERCADNCMHGTCPLPPSFFLPCVELVIDFFICSFT